MARSSSLFRLRPMQRADTEAVRRLWARRFGGDPDTRQKWIDAVLDPDRTATAYVAEASTTPTIVGVGVLEVGRRDYARDYLGVDALGLDVSLAHRNGFFHLCCVRADWEGRSVGSALHVRRLRALAERPVPRVFGVAWHRPHTVDSRALFDKHGFTALATVPRYYARTTPRPHCPDCDGFCTCTATLCGRSVPGTNGA